MIAQKVQCAVRIHILYLIVKAHVLSVGPRCSGLHLSASVRLIYSLIPECQRRGLIDDRDVFKLACPFLVDKPESRACSKFSASSIVLYTFVLNTPSNVTASPSKQ